jgi:hypothetical protein
MLCQACKRLLNCPTAEEKYTHHSKECRLWPFGFYERLNLLGLIDHPKLQPLFTSYRVPLIAEDGLGKRESILSLFDSFGISFSALPIFAKYLTRSISLPSHYLVSERAESFLCSSLTSGSMQNICARMELRWKNPEMGWGLFAYDSFQVGEILGVYSGEVKSLSYFSKGRDLTYTAELIRTFPWSRPLVVDAKKVGSLLRFINHKDEPNLSVEYVQLCSLPFLLVSPLRPIAAGEELFLSYGERFWKEKRKLFQS